MSCTKLYHSVNMLINSKLMSRLYFINAACVILTLVMK